MKPHADVTKPHSDVTKPHSDVTKPHLDVIKRFGFVKTRDRKCRNCVCLVLFLLSWLAYIIIGSLGIYYGRPEAFVYGTDYQGNLCGTESLANAKYIVYPRTNQDFLWNINTKNPLEYKFFGICTPHCPGVRGDIDFVCDYTIHRPTQRLPVSREFVLDCLARQDQVAQCRTIRKHCYHVPVPTKPILNRCIPAYEFNYTKTKTCLFPTQISDASDPDCLVVKATVTTESEEPSTPVLLFDQLNQLYFSTGRYITDIVRSWWVIALSAIAIPALLSALWLAALKRFTHAVIVAAILTLLTAGILLTLFIFAQSGTIQYDWIAQYNLEQYAFLSDESTLYLAYGMTAFMLLIFFVLFSLRKSIARSIHVLKLGSKALRKLPMALVFPLNVVVLILSLFVWAAYVAASLASAGETVVVDVRHELELLKAQANSTVSRHVIQALENATREWDGSLTYYAGNTALNWLQIYNAFMFLWSAAFVNGFAIMVTASAVAMWYFSKNKSKQPDLKVHKLPKYYILDSVARTLLFHTGTIAVGSLLIAVISTIRWFVSWLQAQLMRHNYENETTYIPVNIRLAIDCIFQCLLRTMQTLLEIVTHYSYIHAAIKGNSFAESGRQVFSLILKYTTMLASVSVMTNAVITICKLSICVSSCFIYYMIISSAPQFQPGQDNMIHSPIVSMILCFLLSYIISSGFFNTFSIAVDTILICYVTDIDENELRHMGDKRFRFPAHVKTSTFSFLPQSAPE